MVRRKKIMPLQIFLQSEFLIDIEVIELKEKASPKELHSACFNHIADALGASEAFLYIEDDDDEDAVAKLGEIPDGLRVHLHRLKAIDVSVRYAGKDVHRTFRPNATIARVKLWATKDLAITPADAAELMLQIAGTDTRPDPDVHIGSLVKAPQHSICFDLVPAPRVNG